MSDAAAEVPKPEKKSILQKVSEFVVDILVPSAIILNLKNLTICS